MRLSDRPKILLVTWTPPGGRNVGEIILRDLCSFLSDESLVVCEVSDFPEASSRYARMRLPAPDERPWRPLPGRLGGLLNHLRVRSRLSRDARSLVEPIAAFARKHEVDRVWLVLSTQALMAMGHELARELRLPLLSLVWDPPEFLARHQGWDSSSIRWSSRNFAAAMAASTRAMVVSSAMVEQYERDHGVPCVIVRHAFDSSAMPVLDRREEDEFLRIGFAGTLYDHGQLDALVKALNAMDWSLDGRPIALRMIGNRYRFRELSKPAMVELLGWRSTEETRQLLSECEINYLPIPFGRNFVEFARLAFPTKLSTYLAAGKPVLVHAPAYAEPVEFCRQRQFGLACTSMSPVEIGDAIVSLADSTSQRRFSEGVRATCQSLFTRDVMRTQFAKFIGVEAASLAR